MLAVFIGAIALTGTILQAIMVVYGDTGPRQAPGEPFWVVRLRDWAVTVHTGAFTGISGVYVGMICALGLLFFSVSGVWMYLELYRSRAAQGRKALFWGARAGTSAVMRSLHRWITLPFGLFGLLLSLTGASLDLYFARYDQVPLPPPRTMQGGPGGGPRLGGRPGPPPANLRGSPGGPFGLGRPSGAGGPPGPPPAGRAWHDLSLSIHKLNFLGWTGHVLGFLMGVALLTLAVSGAWMFCSLYKQRRKAGWTEVFW